MFKQTMDSKFSPKKLELFFYNDLKKSFFEDRFFSALLLFFLSGFKTVKLEVFVVGDVGDCINDDDDNGDDDDDCTIEHRCEYLHWSNTRSKTGEGLSGGKLTKSGEGDGKKEIKTSFVHR